MDNPIHAVGELLWWVNSDCEPIQVEVLDYSPHFDYTVKDIDTGEKFYYITHKLLLHFEVFSLVSAKVRLTEQILDKRQELEALLEKRKVIRDRQIERENCNE